MFSRISKVVLSIAVALVFETSGRANSYTYNFDFTTNLNEVGQQDLHATGFFTVDNQGTLSLGDITSWSLSATGAPFTYVLDSSNSNLTLAGNTTVQANSTSLTFSAPTQSDGFEMNGVAKVGTDTFNVDWVYAEVGPANLITIAIPSGPILASGLLLSFPSKFTASAQPSVSPAPEPSSWLLIATGGLLIIAGAARKLGFSRA